MKKIAVCLFAMASLVASAACEKVATAEIADVNTLVAAVAKVGQMTGNSMLGFMMSSAVTESEVLKFFGPMRENSTVTVPLYVDADALGTNVLESLDKAVSVAVVYPTALTKAEFLRDHSEAVETNGVIRLVRGDDDDDEDADDDEAGEKTTCADGDDVFYAAFDKSGRNLVFAQTEAMLRRVLADDAAAGRPMAGDLLRVTVAEKGIGVASNVVATAMRSVDAKEKADLELAQKLLAMVRDCAGAIRLTDAGLEYAQTINVVAGSELDRVGKKPVSPKPFAAAGSAAIAGVAAAADSGSEVRNFEVLRRQFAAAGLAFDGYLSCAETNGLGRLVIDLEAAVRYFTSDAFDTAKIDTDKLAAIFDQGDKSTVIPLTNAAATTVLEIKGHASAFALQDRLEATLPEAAGRKPVQVGFLSLSSLLRAAAPAVIKELSKSDQSAVKMLLSSLPAEGRGGVAWCSWRENSAWKGLLRISAEEIQGVSTIFSAVTAYMVSSAMKNAGEKLGDADDDDDDDDADDKH